MTYSLAIAVFYNGEVQVYAQSLEQTKRYFKNTDAVFKRITTKEMKKRKAYCPTKESELKWWNSLSSEIIY